MRFANARADDRLIKFVSEFGPVLARVEHVDDRNWTLVQNLEVLRAEQTVFLATQELVALVNDLDELSRAFYKKRTDDWESKTKTLARYRSPAKSKLERLAPAFERLLDAFDAATEVYRTHPVPVDVWSRGAKSSLYDPDPGIPAIENLSTAHDTLCEVFNSFPPKLFYGGGSVIELPLIEPTGIRPLLYFLLRETYLLKRRIRICERDKCNQFFIPDRIDGRFCSDPCGDADRHQSKRKRDKSEGANPV